MVRVWGVSAAGRVLLVAAAAAGVVVGVMFAVARGRGGVTTAAAAAAAAAVRAVEGSPGWCPAVVAEPLPAPEGCWFRRGGAVAGGTASGVAAAKGGRWMAVAGPMPLPTPAPKGGLPVRGGIGAAAAAAGGKKGCRCWYW